MLDEIKALYEIAMIEYAEAAFSFFTPNNNTEEEFSKYLMAKGKAKDARDKLKEARREVSDLG